MFLFILAVNFLRLLQLRLGDFETAIFDRAEKARFITSLRPYPLFQHPLVIYTLAVLGLVVKVELIQFARPPNFYFAIQKIASKLLAEANHV
jgi:hypothetical protein